MTVVVILIHGVVVGCYWTHEEAEKDAQRYRDQGQKPTLYYLNPGPIPAKELQRYLQRYPLATENR